MPIQSRYENVRNTGLIQQRNLLPSTCMDPSEDPLEGVGFGV